MDKHSILLVLTFILLGSFCNSQNLIKRRCNTSFRCSYEEKPVWATTTGQDCLVYRNGCHFLSANCDRVNREEPPAIPIDKDSCQSKCGQMCPPFFVPICAILNEGQMQTFGNQCELENHICKTGLTYSIFRAEACPENLKQK
ncbi:uncharacterized protein LOC129940553 [Eupeodes corollae]|uniref:uncharacterized protein LOC129940553 n=1 Tax=Eupeodes corollae TaxID=290404 RepID=UPI002492A3D7|nr:uncharacterized protein LOC129940553 [Eupeodes corollae]